MALIKIRDKYGNFYDIPGIQGQDGTSIYCGEVDENSIYTVQLPNGFVAKNGDLILANDGKIWRIIDITNQTAEETGITLQGPQGTPGQKGDPGEPGKPGTKIEETFIQDGDLYIKYTDSEVPVLIGPVVESATNKQELDFFPLDDGTYGVAAGNSKYLSKITIPETYNGKNVTKIVSAGFQKHNATEIILPNTITSIEELGFSESNFSKIQLPDGVEIKQNAFKNNYLTSVDLSQVSTLGVGAFEESSELAEIILPKSGVSILPTNFLYNSEKLRDVFISDKFKTLTTKSLYLTSTRQIFRINNANAAPEITSDTFNIEKVLAIIIPTNAKEKYIKSSKWNDLLKDKLMEYGNLTATRFTFSLLGGDYTALKDITWKEWLQSPLVNQIPYIIRMTGEDDDIYIETEGLGSGYLYLDGHYIKPSEKIVENGNYIIENGG